MEKEKKEIKSFDDFTNLYEVQKTLRFELRPDPKTREWMNKHLEYDKDIQTFFKDQKIEDAYQTLKPIFDKIHEDFINKSLENDAVSEIDFSEYFNKYQNRKEIKEEELSNIEKSLRSKFEEVYKKQAEKFKEKTGKDNKDKDILKEKGVSVLTEKGILRYVQKNIEKFKEVKSEKNIKEALNNFEGFFTYFGGFNKNRENYYEIKKEASTAVATRIVHENLPKFCDNILAFELQKEKYLNAHNFLKEKGNLLQDKEGNLLYSIKEDIFEINHFNECLSQNQIEEYNKIIGNANYIVNLYNQAYKKEGGFTKLSLFKTLYKQIGCGKRDSLFFSLNYNKKNDYEKKNEKDIQSVEEVLKMASQAGKKYFYGKNNPGEIKNINDFIEYIKNKENYFGVYWSKVALNTISNKYFSNWHTLKDKLKEAKVFTKGKNGDEEDIKIPEAIELEGFFNVLDESIKEIEDKENNTTWKSEGLFFKKSLTEILKNFEENKKNQKRKDLIEQSNKPSQALLALIFDDIQEFADKFINTSDEVLKIEKYFEKESKEKIKFWMDNAIAINRMLKYFLVKESKTKGEPIDPVITIGLDTLLRSDNAQWFKWYDALRNYLTKKPQDDAKENKLKLNFENGSLLGGWSDGVEKTKGAVLLKKDDLYYLGILKNKSIFDTEKEDNKIYKNQDSESGRLILTNLKFQTLAGKGFLGRFGESYGEMGKRDPIKAIKFLQEIIRDKYSKYPLLKRISESSYFNKKDFDLDIQKTLKDSYVCKFKSINWNEVEKLVEIGDLYLFEIKITKKKLQTLYWYETFQKNSKIQLNGGGEVFYRKKVFFDKKIKKGYEKKPFVIENKRFAEEKFLFHCPLKINYKAKSYSKPVYAISEINKFINENISQNQNTCFLGIDRGEKHLAYYSLINQKGEIIKQDTLNMPFVDKDGKPRIIKVDKRTIDKDGKEKLEIVDCKDYNDLLEARSGNRDYARKNWQTIETIKELKNGYISQVIRKIVDIAVDKNRETPSFIILENLNVGFKRGRQKIEKQVYQKLELALAKKMNFLVDKNAKNNEVGSVTNALQLTPPVNNFGDIENKKQFGIMLYTKADYTSQTDPITGWRKSVYLKKGSEEYIKGQIIKSFDDIGFNGQDYYFDYTVDYLDPKNKKSDRKFQKQWRLYSSKNGVNLDRFRGERNNDKNQWISEPQDILKILKNVFEDFNLNRSLLSQIINEGINPKKIDSKHTGWESLRFAIDMIQQIRNTGIEKLDEDFILSPVRDENGNHFDSRNAKENQPTSGDANGAYNIARKGIIMNEHIKMDLTLFIRDEEWDVWLAGKVVWNAWIEKNKKDLLYKVKK